MELDASGTTTLDAWQPSKEGHLLAYQLSEGGTEESVLRVHRCRNRRASSTVRSTGRATPPLRGCPVARPTTTFAGFPPSWSPTARSSSTDGCGCTASAPTPTPTRSIFGDGLDATNYYGVTVSRDGRWLIDHRIRRHRATQRPVGRRLSTSSPDKPELVTVQEGVDAQTIAALRARRTASTSTPTATHRAAASWSPNPASGRSTNGVTSSPKTPRPCLKVGRSSTVTSCPTPSCSSSEASHAVGRITRHDLRYRRPRPAQSRCRASARSPGSATAPKADTRPGSATPTTSRRRRSTTTTRARTPPRCGPAPPGSVDVPPATSEQVVYQSKDGTDVRMFVIRRSDAVAGPAPTILNGYGGFGVPLTPAYSATILAWVEAGGRLRRRQPSRWRRGGRGLASRRHARHQAERLRRLPRCRRVAHRRTASPRRDQLTISGGSNGGLLVGAALTQRPDLYAAVICAAPLLDMVRYEKHGLGPTWSDEYGTAADADELGWLLSYSPYHHVREGVDYPATLFTVFDGDTRVDPLHGRKMAAALQHATTGSRPVLVRRESDVGHGARAVSRAVELSVDTLAFAAAQTGLDLGRLTR